MEGQAGPGGGRPEVVMVPVDQFVQAACVEGTVNPVDEGFRKEDQCNDTEDQVAPAVVTDVEIDPTGTAQDQHHDRGDEHRVAGDRHQGQDDRRTDFL